MELSKRLLGRRRVCNGRPSTPDRPSLKHCSPANSTWLISAPVRLLPATCALKEMPCELLREQPAVMLHWLFALTPAFRMPEDFHGKKVASPQFGNTQDIDLRDWLSKHGLKPRERGGDVQITPIANPDQLTLFLRKQLDAAWAPEPWAARLIHEAGGKLLVDERAGTTLGQAPKHTST